jgi:thioesterase domain-containing protein
MDERLRQLQDKLLVMPPVQALQLRVGHWAEGRLTLLAPLAPNVNDKGCAFGGSLASLMTLSAWGLTTLQLVAAGFGDAEVYVQDSRIEYLAPLYEDIEAEAFLAAGVDWDGFIASYRERGKARGELQAEVRRADGVVATRFSGRFVALRPKSG